MEEEWRKKRKEKTVCSPSPEGVAAKKKKKNSSPLPQNSSMADCGQKRKKINKKNQNRGVWRVSMREKEEKKWDKINVLVII